MPTQAARYVTLGAYTAGIYTCYLLYGIFQESLYKKQEDGSLFAETAFVLLVQCVFNAAVSLVADVLIGALSPGGADRGKHAEAPGSLRWVPMLATREVAVTSIVYILAMYTSNEALQYVTYPTQALAKSCKMIPVLVGRVVISGQRYSWVKYACVALMTVGIAAFQFAGKKRATAEGFGGEGMGMALLAVSLMLDGMAGPFQENLKRTHKMTNNQQIIVNNVWASALMLGVALALGQFWKSLAYLATHPKVVQALVLFSLCSAFGQIFIFLTIRTFDSLTLSTITTTRKFFTIVASVVVHGNVLNNSQWLAVLVVFAGLSLEVVDGYLDGGKRARKAEAAGAGAGAAAGGVAGASGESGAKAGGKPASDDDKPAVTSRKQRGGHAK